MYWNVTVGYVMLQCVKEERVSIIYKSANHIPYSQLQQYCSKYLNVLCTAKSKLRCGVNRMFTLKSVNKI